MEITLINGVELKKVGEKEYKKLKEIEKSYCEASDALYERMRILREDAERIQDTRIKLRRLEEIEELYARESYKIFDEYVRKQRRALFE